MYLLASALYATGIWCKGKTSFLLTKEIKVVGSGAGLRDKVFTHIQGSFFVFVKHVF